jgi:gamma-glutamyltranspeptidase/glutathione hydrolase
MSVIVGRSRIATRYGIVAASQPLAARAGVQVLERGGNAIDAAIATNAVLGLVEPQSNGIGGDLFAIVYEAKTGALHGLNACGWAPGGLTPVLLKSRGLTQMPQNGIHTVTVPGAVAGWDARTRFHLWPMCDLSSRSTMRWCFRRRRITLTAPLTENRPSSPMPRRFTFPTATRPARVNCSQTGPRQPLRLIANHGPAGFYEPDRRRHPRTSREGGTMTAADPREFQPEWVDPITSYRGWDVAELPPTQGIAAR